MRNLAIGTIGAMLAVLTAAGVAAACKHDILRPTLQPAPREVPPLGPRPEPVEPGLVHRAARTEPEVAARDPEAIRTGVPVDAAVDGQVSLPPVPDASVLRDAGTPMQ